MIFTLYVFLDYQWVLPDLPSIYFFFKTTFRVLASYARGQLEFCACSFIKIPSHTSSDSHFIIYQNTCFLYNGHEAAQNTVVFSI